MTASGSRRRWPRARRCAAITLIPPARSAPGLAQINSKSELPVAENAIESFANSARANRFLIEFATSCGTTTTPVVIRTGCAVYLCWVCLVIIK